jgi:hypothetical protein
LHRWFISTRVTDEAYLQKRTAGFFRAIFLHELYLGTASRGSALLARATSQALAQYPGLASLKNQRKPLRATTDKKHYKQLWHPNKNW